MDKYKYGGRNSYSNNSNKNEHYNDQGSSSGMQDLNQGYLTNLDTNNSTRSLGGATAVETPRVNPTGNDEDVNSLNSQHGAYNHEAHQSSLYGQPKCSMDEENSSRPGSVLTKRDSTTALNNSSAQNLPLIGQSTYDLGNVGNQHYNDYNQSNGYYSQYNKYHRQDDPYYDEEARHNTLTGDPYAYGQYTDRDFPGGGKGARQSMIGEHLNLTVPEKKKKKRKCCGCSCCTWPVCLLITLIILAGLGATGFFVFPRRPEFKIKDAIPVTQPIISMDPPFIDMNFTMIIDIDNNQNYVPYKFNRIDVSIFDRNVKDNEKPIATGTKLDYTLEPKQVDTLEFPLNVNYNAQDQKDPVIQDFFNACSPKVKKHTKLKLRIEVTLSIWGIDWIYKPKIPANIPDFNCPKLPKL